MDLGLRGKTAVVTGASRGIGYATVESLVNEGANVVAGSRDISGMQGRAQITAVTADLATAEGCTELIERARAIHGGVDYLVNNVGVMRMHPAGFGSETDEDWQFSFQMNLMSAVRTTRAALPLLIESKGTVVNVSSANGRMPAGEIPEYSAMKAAMLSFTGGLARQLAAQGVRVNAVTPGPVLTDMQIGPGGVAELYSQETGGTTDDYINEVKQASPLGRFAAAQEIADAILFLLSPRSGYTSGAELAIDGVLRF